MYKTPRSARWVSAGLLGLITLVGCGGPPAMSTPEQTPAAVTPVAEAGTNQLCDALQGPLSETVLVQFAVSEARFRDLGSGVELNGCQLTANGTGVQFTDFVSVAEQVSMVLNMQGWGEAQPVADGPTGTVLRFEKDDNVAQVAVDWQPAPEVSCPADQPITDCAIAPEHKLYTITVNAAPRDAVAQPVVEDEEELKQAVYTYVMENTQIRAFTVVPDQAEGDIARVEVRGEESGVDTAIAYARRLDGYWTVIGFGTGFDPEFYTANAIPESLWLGQP